MWQEDQCRERIRGSLSFDVSYGICTYRYMYMWLGKFWIHVLLETCTLTFHLHVHVAWIVLDSCGDTCTSGYFWIYMYFWRHVHWHFSYKWMIHFTLNLFFGFHMFLCDSIVLICVDYLLLINALCQKKKLLNLKVSMNSLHAH